jgi:hypothetical protein
MVKQTVHLKEQEFHLDAREGLIRKMEHLLAIGQKQFAGAEADEQDLETFVDVNEKIVRERATREIGRRDRKVDAQLAVKREELRAREAAIEVREKAYSALYKAEAAEKLEAKMRAELERAMAVRETAEYNRGLAEGKVEGQAVGNEQLRHTWYDKGFSACHAMFERMKRFQAGLLAPDSPEIAFLFDPSHPDHPFSRGLQMGRRDAALSSQPSPGVNEADDVTSVLRPAGLPSRIDKAAANINSVGPPAKPPHPYAHATHDSTTDTNGTHPLATTSPARLGDRITPPALADHDVTADPLFGVPQYGTRTAVRAVHPSLLNPTPQTPAMSGAITEGGHSARQSGDDVHALLSGRRLVSYGRAEGEDEKVHKGDLQVDLIDLY